MATYTVVNGTETDISNLNAGGVDVGAMTYRNGITLTNTELATLLDGATFNTGKAICVFPDLTGLAQAEQVKRAASVAAMYLNGLA